MSFCRTAGTRTSRCAIGAICVAAGLASHGAASLASASEAPFLPVRWTAAPGSDVTEIRVADAHTAANAEGATQPDPECLKKHRWQPKLRAACQSEGASPSVSSLDEAMDVTAEFSTPLFVLPNRSISDIRKQVATLYISKVSCDERPRTKADQGFQ